jgi:hypothetical protein
LIEALQVSPVTCPMSCDVCMLVLDCEMRLVRKVSLCW